MARSSRFAAAACALAVLALIAGGTQSALAAEPAASVPLHERIDRLVEEAAIGPLAPLASDADFVRRVYLDLTGIIPTAAQARAFLEDASPAKRERLVDALLASPAFARHMAVTLDVMLMERRPEKNIKQAEWEAYLFESLAANKPLDGLFRELIVSSGEEGSLRAAGRFLLDRDAEPNLVVRDLGRLAFGMDLGCCQCHDHPLIDDYYQEDYYGLMAFVHRTSLFTDPKTKQVLLTEKADGEASYKSVFTGDGNDRVLPRLPKGAVLFVEPKLAPADLYKVKPDKTVRGVPRYSRREALAERLAESQAFRRNLANRLWMIVFGRGLVHPVDFHHTHNPPSHPRLLELLADELAAGGYQLRPFVRELLLSRTYARTCDAPRAETINLADIAARQALIDKQRQAAEAAVPALDKAVADARSALRKAREADSKLTAELPKLEAAVKAAEQKLTQATSERAKAEATAAKAQQQAQAVAEAAAKLEVAAEVVAEDESIRVAAAAISAKASQLGSAASAAAVVAAEKAAEQKAAEKLLADARSKVSEAASNRLTPERFEALAQAELTASAALAEGRYAVAQVRGELAIAKAISEHAAMTDPAKADAAWQALVDQWTINLQVAPLKPLTPEQMAASVMQAAGVLGPEAAAIAAKLEKSPPEALKKASDGERERLMASLVDKGLLERLRGAASEFVRQYGGQSGQDFQATVNQALFFGNGGVVDGWLKPAGENLVARLNAMTDSDQLAEELYLAVFSRFPSEAERRETAAYLKDRSDRPVAIAELAWALLSSSEFRFNH